MQQFKALSISLVAGLLILSGCGKKDEAEVHEQSPQLHETAPQQGAAIDQATVGEVSGKIVFTGEKPKLGRLKMDQDPACAAKHSSAVLAEDGAVNDNGTLPNAFVYVKQGAEKYTFPTPAEAVVLDQDGCMYKPHVLGLQTNQTLRITTSDPTTHNVHPVPKENREWNMSQAPNAPPIEQKFARPEIMVPIKCNQHPWMKAYVGVTRHPFFAVTGADGTFTIKGLPPGTYTLAAWTATFGEQEQPVTVGPKESKSVDFTFKGTGS
jgi:hypothetical protein